MAKRYSLRLNKVETLIGARLNSWMTPDRPDVGIFKHYSTHLEKSKEKSTMFKRLFVHYEHSVNEHPGMSTEQS